MDEAHEEIRQKIECQLENLYPHLAGLKMTPFVEGHPVAVGIFEPCESCGTLVIPARFDNGPVVFGELGTIDVQPPGFDLYCLTHTPESCREKRLPSPGPAARLRADRGGPDKDEEES